MELSVCVDSVYQGIELSQAMKEIKALGIDRIECWSWWDKDLRLINQSRLALEMKVSGICTRFVSLTDPVTRDLYLTGLKETIEVAKLLKCPLIISQVGDDTGESVETQLASIVEGLKGAATLLEGEGITLVIEPLNTLIDHPGYFLTSSDQGRNIISAVGSPQVKLLFDCYHQHIMGEDIMTQCQKLIPFIGHLHLANYPGRHELEQGEIDYQELIAQVNQLDYVGALGLEYFPTEEPKRSLSFWQEQIKL